MNSSSSRYEWDRPPLPPAPKVVWWFKIYAGVMLGVYALVAVVGVVMLAMPEILVDPNAGVSSNRPADTTEVLIIGGIYLALGVVLGVAFLIALLLGRSKGAWVYHLVLICIGLTSCCCWPASIPLLVFWLKSDVRNWYGFSV